MLNFLEGGGRAADAIRDLPAQTMFVVKPLDPRFILGEIDRLSA